MACDLHTHSVFSDGTYTPEQLIAAAERGGLTAVALCDHNTVKGLPVFMQAAEQARLDPVPGVELSVEYGSGELHLLALFLKEADYPAAEELLGRYQARKEESNRRLVTRLQALGYPVDYRRIRAASPQGVINRAHIAAELTRLGCTASIEAAFRDLLAPEKGIYEPPRRTDVFEAIAWIRSVGAVAVLAHPLLNLTPEGLEAFLERAVPCGLDGMETVYSTYSTEEAALAAKLAARFGLLPSGGSDFHGSNKPDIQLGTGRGDLHVPDAFYRQLRALAAKRRPSSF